MYLIRKAVGAIAIFNGKILLVHKQKMMESKNGPEKVNPHWDIPKGGVKDSDECLESALLRELREETGSEKYKIIKKFDEKILFTFPAYIALKIGYMSQETTLFLVEYVGNGDDLLPIDDEIAEVGIFSKEYALDILEHEESKSFIKSIPDSDFILGNKDTDY